MKFVCDKNLLLSAVTTASRAASVRSPIPALEGLLIEANTKVKITGYNLKEGIFTDFEAEVQKPGSVVINARLFSEIIRSLPEETVTLSSDENSLATVTCGNSNFRISGTDAADYPEIPPVNPEKTISLKQSTLKNMINQTIFAVSENESRPIYTGSLFEVSEGQLTIVSVDGYRLAMRKEQLDDAAEEGIFIVPGNALSDAEKICQNNDDPIKIAVSDKNISFIAGNTVLISRRLEGEFLNYKKSIPATFGISLVVNADNFTRVIERVSLIIDDKVKNPLKFLFGKNEIFINCETARGRAEDICAAEGNGNDLEIGFNNRYLLDALKAAPSEKIILKLNTGSSPCVLTPENENDSFLYMILPVRLKAGD
ncbi:MAG: DNA polymerase III subunit beta [Oscillospiraceae bacterium]|nr:DNA polymerase III subunit beta [Oscillospiraceae bacterium]